MDEVGTIPRKIKLIANPVAGGDAGDKIRQAELCLAKEGAQVELFLTAARGDAARAAAEAKSDDFDLIVAAGGDGTLNEVINGLVPSKIPLAFVPLGTTNVFALETGIPFDIDGACRIALSGMPTPICLGVAGDTRFLLMAGAGFDAEVVHRVDLQLKRRLGKLAYLVSAMKVFFEHSPRPFEVLLEDRSRRTGYGLIVGNGRLYGGRFSLTPGAALTEDQFEVCLLQRPGRLGLLHCLLRILLRRSLIPAGAFLFKTRELTVSGDSVSVQIDGDPHEQLPMTFRAVPGELLMVMPSSTGT
jgi:diacylglycerol kinase (ATP)